MIERELKGPTRPSRPLEGEDLKTTRWEDARHWMSIYADLRVPEVWRYDGRRVTMYRLDADGTYRACETSPSFPGLRPSDVERFIERGQTTPKRQWAREIRDFVRAELIPRRDVPEGRDGGGPAPA